MMPILYHFEGREIESRLLQSLPIENLFTNWKLQHEHSTHIKLVLVRIILVCLTLSPDLGMVSSPQIKLQELYTNISLKNPKLVEHSPQLPDLPGEVPEKENYTNKC